jgi:hypothetical protein
LESLRVIDADSVDGKAVSDDADHCHQEDCHNQSEEILVVRFTHTVVEPSAVVIKPVHTSIARATVLCIIMDMALAYFTEELEL